MLLYNFKEQRTERIEDLSTIDLKQFLPDIDTLHMQFDDYVASGHTEKQAYALCVEDYYTSVYEELGDWYTEKGIDNDTE